MDIIIKTFAALLLGAISWTLAEYLIHRFLGHVPVFPLTHSRFFKEHAKHHYKKNYFASFLDKFLTGLVAIPMTFFLASLITTQFFSLAYTLGFLGMYLCYESVHRRLHRVAPPYRYAAKLRFHHFYHHFMDENMNHGVTTLFWDRAFGTYRSAAEVSLPEKYRPIWANFPANGNTFTDRYNNVYRLTQKLCPVRADKLSALDRK